MRAMLGFRFAAVPFVVMMLANVAPLEANDAEEASPRIIAEVKMVGYHHRPTQDILPPFRSQVGQAYDPAIVQEDVRALIASNEFGSVQARYRELPDGKIEVSFVVTPLPEVIEEVVYKGVHVVKPSELEGITGLKTGMRAWSESLRTDCAKIVQHYNEKGHPFATCVLLEGGAPTDSRIVFSIEEGPEVIVQGVVIEGTANTSALQEYLKTMPRHYIPSAVDQMAHRLRGIFAYGHVDSSVSPELRWNADNTGVTIVFKVDRGVCLGSHYPPPSPEFIADEYKSQPPPPKHPPARSDILRALDADSCDQELTRVSYCMLFPVIRQWLDSEAARNFGTWEREEETPFFELLTDLLYSVRQETALDPMTVTTHPLVFRDQLYASRSLFDRSAIKLPREGLAGSPAQEPDLPVTRSTRSPTYLCVCGCGLLLDHYEEAVIDLGFVNLLMRRSWEALVNGERIEAEKLLAHAWYHDPEGVASHPLLPRIQVLSNVLLNAEEQSPPIPKESIAQQIEMGEAKGFFFQFNAEEQSSPKPQESIAQQIPDTGEEENSESQEAGDATTPDFQAAIPTMTRCALFTVHPVLAFWPELQTIWDAATTYGGLTLPNPKYLEHPPSYEPESPPDDFDRWLAETQALQAQAEAPVRKEGVDASKPVRKDAAPVQIQLDLVVTTGRGGLARNLASHLLPDGDHAGEKQTASVHCTLQSPHERDVLLSCLQTLRSAGLMKLLAEPRLVTMSGRQASFLSGGEQAIPIPAGLGSIGVQFEEFGTRLNFLPTVLGDGTLRLEVESEVRPSPEAPAQRSKTTSVLKKGQTLLIAHLAPKAGAKKDTVSPKAGKSEDGEDDEMIVLVSPKIIAPDSDVKPAPGREEESEQKNTQKRLRRLEHKLKRIQDELDELKRDR